MSIRRMNRVHGVYRSHCMIVRRAKNFRTGPNKSRNTRVTSQTMREKFGVKVPNSTKEALILNRINGDNK